jgi:hypothetical protein
MVCAARSFVISRLLALDFLGVYITADMINICTRRNVKFNHGLNTR